MAEKRDKRSNAKEDIINRVYVLYGIFIVLGLCIAARLVWIQVADKRVEQHIEVMKKNIKNTETLYAHRGAILTCDGEPLAMTNRRYQPKFDFASEGMSEEYHKKDPTKITRELRLLANQMALFFNKSDAELHGYKYRSADVYYDIFIDKLNNKNENRNVAIFPRSVVRDDWDMMRRKFPVINRSLGGVYKIDTGELRIRPYDDLALQLIGECRGEKATVAYDTIEVRDKDNKIREKILKRDTTLRRTSGIEKIYDSLLAGKNGAYVEQRIANGFWVRVDDPSNSKPIDGHNVITTIDGDLQQMATEALRRKLEAEHASFGVAMVMEVKTGNMLCMVNLSSGVERGKDYRERINHAMRTRTTPGSTFKLVSAMALLEIGGATINTKVHIPSTEATIGTRTVRDEHTMRDEDDKQITHPTLVDGFAHSSNIYFSKAIFERFKDDPSVFTSYLESLLFNKDIGLKQYGAKLGRVPSPTSDTWKVNGGKNKVFPQMGYGYVVEIPPIQTLTFYNGIANGGKMMAPRFIDRLEHDGVTTEILPSITLIERMCSEQTISDLFTCLKAAAAPDRTNHKLTGLPVNIGCKTGTAQLWGDFSSVTRQDKQSFKEGLGNEEGKHKYYLGSLVAIMPIENPKYTIMVAVAKEKTSSHPTYYGISLSADPMRDIIHFIYNNDPTLHASVEQSGTTHMPTMVKPDYSLASDIEAGFVPNVIGMGLTDALYLLEQQGLTVTHSGAGRVVSQSIEPNTPITQRKNRVHITLGI